MDGPQPERDSQTPCLRVSVLGSVRRVGGARLTPLGDAGGFLELSDDERRFVEMKAALAAGLRGRREQQGLTQVALARRLGSRQSRIAKMEAADRTVSPDLLVRAPLLAARQEWTTSARQKWTTCRTRLARANLPIVTVRGCLRKGTWCRGAASAAVDPIPL